MWRCDGIWWIADKQMHIAAPNVGALWCIHPGHVTCQTQGKQIPTGIPGFSQTTKGFQSQSKDKNNQQLLNSMLCCTLDQFFLSELRLITRGGRRDEVFKSCPYLIFLSWREMILLIVGVSVMSRLVPWPLKYKVAFITHIIPASSASSQTSVHYLKESI